MEQRPCSLLPCLLPSFLPPCFPLHTRSLSKPHSLPLCSSEQRWQAARTMLTRLPVIFPSVVRPSFRSSVCLSFLLSSCIRLSVCSCLGQLGCWSCTSAWTIITVERRWMDRMDVALFSHELIHCTWTPIIFVRSVLPPAARTDCTAAAAAA